MELCRKVRLVGSERLCYTHISKDRKTEPNEPFSTIPFAPDPEFVKRVEILEWVRNKCARPGARAALVGLGGVG